MALLEIENLVVEFQTATGPFRAVDGVSLSVDPREVLAIVGESGSGKSVSMLAVMGLLPWTAKVTADTMIFDGRDLLTLSVAERRKMVGKDMAMIFQEPMASLNPCFTVGFQIEEVLKVHMGIDRRPAPRPGDRTSEAGRHPAAGRAAWFLSAPDVGRPVPARDDRHRDRLQSEAVDRRRADHGARRDDPEADPRPSGPAAGRVRHGA